MSRATAKAAQNQLNTTNSAAGQQMDQANNLEGQLTPSYESMMNNGFTPSERGAITTSGMGATGAPFDAAANQAENRAARTNNASGVAGEEDQLARDKGVAMGGEASAIEMANMGQKEVGRQGLANLQGRNLNAGESLYGQGTPAINAWQNATQNPWMSMLQAGIGAGGAVGAAKLGA